MLARSTSPRFYVKGSMGEQAAAHPRGEHKTGGGSPGRMMRGPKLFQQVHIAPKDPCHLILK
jgi:hypothetical protein